MAVAQHHYGSDAIAVGTAINEVLSEMTRANFLAFSAEDLSYAFQSIIEKIFFHDEEEKKIKSPTTAVPKK
jgi:hypothetical protein